MRPQKFLSAAGALTGILSTASAMDVDFNDRGSMLSAVDTAFTNSFAWYISPGQLGSPYFWWEAGAMLGLLIQRWSIFGNDTWNDMITEGIMAQIGEHQNFEPEAERLELGNDDQAWWAWTVLDAAEYGFPDAPAEMGPSWLGLAQAVFNRQTLEWDDTSCGGGMRWQKFFQNAGYDYKNAPTNAGYFMIAARLARFTGNETYVEYADRMWDWIETGNFWVMENDGVHIYDGVHIADCGDPNRHNPGQWTYNVGMLLSGAAYMYDLTPEGERKEFWREKIDMLMQNSDRWFFQDLGPNDANQPPSRDADGIIAEAACEFGVPQTCDQDQPVFKGFTLRWFAMTSVLAPWTNETIYPRLVASARGAARTCTGTAPNQIPGTSCGRRWFQSTHDGFTGLGEQLSFASAVQSTLIHQIRPPLTTNTGGTSRNDPGLGNQEYVMYVDEIYTRTITTGDRAGAGILTLLGLGFVIGGGSWMVLGA